MSDLYQRIGLVRLVNTGTTDGNQLKKAVLHITGPGISYDGGLIRRPFLDEGLLDTNVPHEVCAHVLRLSDNT